MIMKLKRLDKLIDYSKLKFKISKTMRYDDVGDYFDTTIVSYDMKNPIVINAIMLHEFIEYTLIKSAGIPVSMIDDFDTDNKAANKHKKEYELYCKYHRYANNVERIFIENMGMDWKSYQKAILNQPIKVKHTGKPGVKKTLKNWKVR